MTLVQQTFDTVASGTAATTANTGAVGVSTGTGGTVTFDSAFAARSTACGLKMLATGSSSVADIRYTLTGAQQYALEFVYTTPAVLPSGSDITFFQLNATARALSLTYRTTGGIRILDSTNAAIDVGTTYSVGTRYRIAMVVNNTAGAGASSLKLNIYTETGTSPIASYTNTTTANLASGNFVQGRWGATGYPAAGAVHGFDDIQWNDGATAEIGPIVAAATSVRPTGLVSNAGAYTNVGGAADIPSALADELDTSYVQSVDNPSGSQFVVLFPTLASGNVTVKTRNAMALSSPAMTRTIELLQSTTVISSRTVSLSTTITDHTWTTSPTETAAITDRTQLRVRITDTI